MQHPALELPPLNPALVSLSNAIRVCAIPREIPFGIGTLSLVANPEVSTFKPACLITLSVNGTPWRLALSDTEWLTLHSVFVDAPESAYAIDALPADFKIALAETLFSPLLKSLSETLGATVLFEDALFDTQEFPGTVAFGFTAIVSSEARDSNICQVAMVLPNQVAVDSLSSILTSAAPKSPRNSLFDSIPVQLSFVAGALELTKADFGDLARGDVLIPQEWFPATKTITIRVIQDGFASHEASCSLENNKATLTSVFHSVQEKAMSEVDDLPVNLSFELENRTITLNEIKSVTEGYVFSLASNPKAPVTIRANGKAIAKGSLVDLNGVIGVQISELIQ